MADRLLKVEKVAERLDVSVRQVWRLVEWGHLADAHQIGRGEVRFYESDVETYLGRLKYGTLPLPPVPERKKRDKKPP